MITFQLDQNVNRKTLWRKCALEGLAIAKRFPEKWRDYKDGFKDPQLLPVVMAGNEPLVTNDREIANEHANFIPNSNPGIIIVGHPKGHIGNLRKGEVEKIIWGFKSKFPKWDSVCWSNSVVTITPLSVEIGHIESGVLKGDCYIEYTALGWADLVEHFLDANAKRVIPEIGR